MRGQTPLSSHYSNTVVGFLAVLSQLAGLAAMVLVSRSSDCTVFLAKQNLTSQCSQPHRSMYWGLSTNTRPCRCLSANPETVAAQGTDYRCAKVKASAASQPVLGIGHRPPPSKDQRHRCLRGYGGPGASRPSPSRTLPTARVERDGNHGKDFTFDCRSHRMQ